MPRTGQKNLEFSSEPFLRVKYFENVKALPIDGKTIVLNVHDVEINIAGKLLRPWSSSIYSRLIIPTVAKIVCITLESDFFHQAAFPHASPIKDKWTQACDIFPSANLEGTRLWRSAKKGINSIELNLWFAEAGTNCGIHNKHDFRELHTQVFGVGRMQKFHENDMDSFYQEEFMSPGYTHEPFYNEDCVYPWHQYYADTDCIWLAAEF